MELLIPLAALGGLFSLTRPRHDLSVTTQESFGLRNDNGGWDDDRNMQDNVLPEYVPPEQAGPAPVLGRTDYVTAPAVALGAKVPFDPAARGGGAAGNGTEGSAQYTGGAAYQAQFLSNTPLGGPGKASAAPFYSSADSYGQLTSAASAQLTLDTHTGAGSLQQHKSAMAPLHAPAADLTYAYGTPNQLDAVRAREYVSMKQNGVRPAPQLREGRGLTLDRSFDGMAAEQGAVGPNNLVDYNSKGTYVDALSARDLYADRPVNELRTLSNPKAAEQYMGGFQGLATNMNAGGRLDDGAPTPKNRPDTFFENVLGLWRGPTSFQHTQSLAPEQFTQYTQRQRTEEEEGGTSYFGSTQGITGGVGSYLMEQDYEPTHRQEFEEMPLGQVDGLRNAAPAADNDYSRWTQPVYENNRSSGPQQMYFGATFSSVLGKYVAPLVDALRPAKRSVMAEADNDSHTFGHFAGTGLGGFGSGTAENGALPAQYLLPVTLKEEGMLEDYFGQATPATESHMGAYHDQNTQLRATERERTTAHSGYLGAAQGLVPAEALPSNQPRSISQKEQTLHGRVMGGNVDKYNPNTGSIGHRKPDAAAPGRAPTASFVASVPSAATYGTVLSKYEHAPMDQEAVVGQKRRIVAANSVESAYSSAKSSAISPFDSGGGTPFNVRGASSRVGNPSEHDFSSQADLNAQIRSRLQASNPLIQNYSI